LPAGASATSSHPYKIPQPPSAIVKYDSDFPLRKTGKRRRSWLEKALFFECACETFNEITEETFFLSVACEITFCYRIALVFDEASNLEEFSSDFALIVRVGVSRAV
jgi:hypothetical protein